MSASERTLLVLGFAPFGPHRRNPSGEIAEALAHGALPGGGWRLATHVLPVARRPVDAVLPTLLETHRPARVLGLGVAPIAAVHVEELAHNVARYALPDGEGEQPWGEPIDATGPAQLPTPLPVGAVHGAIRAAGVPVARSRDPGAYLCNHLYYRLLARGVPSLFLHLPPLPGSLPDPDAPTLALEPARNAVHAALAVLTRLA